MCQLFFKIQVAIYTSAFDLIKQTHVSGLVDDGVFEKVQPVGLLRLR